MATRTIDYLRSLVRELSKLPTEVEWVEFKCNNKNPELIGKYISALSNVATLWDKPFAYLVWGIEDGTHKIIGTDFEYRKSKKGNEELELWLTKMISPKINFKFFEVDMGEDVKVTLLEIPAAEKETTKFESVAMIRVGSNLRPLSTYPEKEREIWRNIDSTPHELRIAASNVPEDEVVRLLDFTKYYDLLQIPLPRERDNIMQDFINEKFLRKNDAGHYDITNMGALLLAKDIRNFEDLVKRVVRVIKYKNVDKTEGILDEPFSGGYAFSHEEITNFIMRIIPQEEEMGVSRVKKVYAFPEIAIRELLANMMIHQSLDQRGTSLMVEIFPDRIEFSNPGSPLIDINRIVDTVPVSRNENIAGFMHKCGICEERGSGYDKVLLSTAKEKLLAPLIINQSNQFTKVVLFSKVPFELTTKEDRVRTCYMQACLAYVNFGAISNSDIRELFDIDVKSSYKSSRIIKDTIAEGLIKPLDPNTAPRYMKYIPYWA